MSALQLPPTAPAPTPAPATTPPAERHLRLVEPPAPSFAPSGPLQAWRRRLGALTVLAVLVTAGIQALAGPTPVTEPATTPVAATTVVVQPGQTLWDIASTHAPSDTSTWTYVDRLAELNGVTPGSLQAWQVLRLPGA